MNRQNLKRSLARYGDFLTINQVAEIIGCDRGTARAWLHGLEYIPVGRSKRFHIDDVVEVVMERKGRL